jgi:chemotaxis protein methyltransferase CheR
MDPAHTTAHPGAPLDPELADFYRRLFALRGLDVSRYRATVLSRRESACLRALRVNGRAQAERAIRGGGDAVDRGLQAVMIGVTSFFRDPSVFAALGHLAMGLPATRGGGLRVLSVGCSDGSELVSTAILLSELGIPARTLAGLDCRPAAVSAARAGVYPEAGLGTIPPGLRASYFEDVPGRPGFAQVTPELRRRCAWWVGDAFAFRSGEPWDIVLCRNLAIYLDPAAARELWEGLTDQLAHDGLLVTGKAERPAAGPRLRRIAPCIYRKT